MFLTNLIERLAELFPRQDYQSRLEQYILSRQPKTASEVEHLQKTYETQEFKGLKL
jgi:hypothetical protein